MELRGLKPASQQGGAVAEETNPVPGLVSGRVVCPCPCAQFEGDDDGYRVRRWRM